jgi:hypothetical protein
LRCFAAKLLANATPRPTLSLPHPRTPPLQTPPEIFDSLEDYQRIWIIEGIQAAKREETRKRRAAGKLNAICRRLSKSPSLEVPKPAAHRIGEALITVARLCCASSRVPAAFLAPKLFRR